MPPPNALTIDVEDYFQVAALAPAAPRSDWGRFEYRVERNVDRLLQIFADRGVRATFFVLGWVAERSPSLVRRIAAAGHEVASHGYSHELIYLQQPDVFRQETARSKNHLEDVLGCRVRGYRAASFSITARSLWALDTLIDLGFEYDSSVFPIRHDRYGLADADPAPGHIQAPSGRRIVEFPMSVASWPGGLRLPVSGGGYFRLLPYALTRAGLSRIRRRADRPFVFYLHPWEIDPGQPRLQVSPLSTFRHYTNLRRCEARLERLLQEFEFDSMSAVLSSLDLLTTPAGSPGRERLHA